MNKLVYILSILIFWVSCTTPVLEDTVTCTNPSATDPVSRAADYQAILEKYEALGIPGIAVLVENNEGTYFASVGMADIRAEQELLACHSGKLGSITKLFMGVLTHQLIEEGRLSLDDPVTKWLAEDVVAGLENAECATLGQLLNHTACIYDLAGDQAYTLAVINHPNTTRTAGELLGFARGREAPCACGEKANYSNTHTLLVSLILEAATGKSHHQLLSDYILDPLNLTNTFYYDHSYPLPPTTTHGYLDIANQGQGLTDVTDWNTGSGHGYTGVYSNVFDLQVFGNALFQENSLLSETQYERMFSDYNIVEDGTWATCYGGGKNFLEKGEGNFALGHGGADLGYSAGLYYFPNQDVLLCYTVNYGRNLETNIGEVLGDFIDEISDAVIGR